MQAKEEGEGERGLFQDWLAAVLTVAQGRGVLVARCLASETTDPHYPGPHRHDLPWLRPSTAIRLTDGHAQDEANGPPSTRGYDVEYGIDEIECTPLGCGARGTPVDARL